MADLRTLDAASIESRVDSFVAIAADIPGEYWTKEHFLVERAGKWRLSFAAWESATPIAYAILSQPDAGRVHLHHFMVARAHRARGLGRRMLVEMLERARASGATRLTLKVASGNERAIAFYRAHGFHSTHWEGEYTVLERALRAAPTRAVVAIHQPNYLPWLGYFRKLAEADVFVFLDNVQFTKGGYTNRVQIDAGGVARWLSVPITVRLGMRIDQIRPSGPDWRAAHLDTLATYYAKAPAYREVRGWLAKAYERVPDSDLAAINRNLVEAIAAALGLTTRFVASSEIPTGDADGDRRLVRIVQHLAPGGVYLSGKGGDKYQDAERFAEAGLELRHADDPIPRYDQGGHDFLGGLSVIDAAFRLGWAGAAELLRVGA
ncbi:MAG: WbqC family protein [Alphaproteobacteria bacterium]